MRHNGSPALHPLSLFYRLDGDKAGAKVWHRSYTCTGIKYCPQINPQLMLSEASGIPFDNFNEVDVQYFKFLWRHRKYAYQNLGPDDLLKRTTKQYWLAFLKNWDAGRDKKVSCSPCKYKGEYTCLYEEPTLFERNGVCIPFIPSTCRPHANNISSINSLVVIKVPTLKFGIWHSLLLLLPMALMSYT